MADNVDITAGSGTKVATDQIPGTLEHIQIVKIADGTADSATRIPGGASGLKVDLTSTGANATAIKVDGSAVTQPVSGTVTVQDGGGSITVDGSVTVDSELTTADLDTGAGTDTRAVVGLVGAKSGGGVLIPGDGTKGLAVDLTATGANTTALKVDGSAVTQPVSGTVTAQGAAADDAAISGNPVPIGLKAVNTTRTAVTTGDVVYANATLQGDLVAVHAIPELLSTQRTTITSSTAETTIVTADVTYKLELYGLIVANTSSTFTKVTLKDSTAGTTRMILSIPGQDTRGFMLPPGSGHKQAAANNNWTVTCGTSVADVEIIALFAKRL